MNKLLLVLMLFVGLQTFAQRKVTISGIVKSRAKGETLIGATVRADGSGGAVTNEYGFYSISLPGGPHELEFSAVGLRLTIVKAEFSRDTTINVLLADESKSM